MNDSDRLLSVEDHLARVLAATRAMPGVRAPLSSARGRVLYDAVTAHADIPAFDNSAMDGFAVLFDDVADASPTDPVTLRVVADLPAGTDLDPPLSPGEAARIMTGSAVPTAADAVVPFEDTAGGLDDSLGEITVLRAPAARGAHVRPQGADARVGDTVLPAGALLGPLQTAAAAAAGVADVVVARPARVAVISTGSELVSPGAPRRRGQIPESNGELLTGLAVDAGAEVVLRRTVDDGGDALRDAVAEASARGADVVIFSGGVSAGAYEVVKMVFSEAMTFSKVAMQPGKPQGFGVTGDGVLLFGLPGNPVSAAVSFEVFVRPALLTMAGRSAVSRPLLRLRATAGWRTPPGRRQYLPVTIDRTDPHDWQVSPATSGGSHLAGGLGRADAYAIVPADVAAVAAGDTVTVMLFS